MNQKENIRPFTTKHALNHKPLFIRSTPRILTPLNLTNAFNTIDQNLPRIQSVSTSENRHISAEFIDLKFPKREGFTGSLVHNRKKPSKNYTLKVFIRSISDKFIPVKNTEC